MHDPDAALLDRLTAPAAPGEARANLAFWQDRLDRTPRHRRAQRREARERVAHWERQVVAAERASSGPLTAQRALALAGWRPSVVRRLARRLAIAAAAMTAAFAALVIAFWDLVVDAGELLLGLALLG